MSNQRSMFDGYPRKYHRRRLICCEVFNRVMRSSNKTKLDVLIDFQYNIGRHGRVIKNKMSRLYSIPPSPATFVTSYLPSQ